MRQLENDFGASQLRHRTLRKIPGRDVEFLLRRLGGDDLRRPHELLVGIRLVLFADDAVGLGLGARRAARRTDDDLDRLVVDALRASHAVHPHYIGLEVRRVGKGVSVCAMRCDDYGRKKDGGIRGQCLIHAPIIPYPEPRVIKGAPS